MAETAGDPGKAPASDEFDMTGVKEAVSLSTFGVVIGVGIPALLFLLVIFTALAGGGTTETDAPIASATEAAVDAMVAEEPMAPEQPADEPAVSIGELANACNAGSTTAAGDQCHAAGLRYLNGDGVAKNPVAAVDYFDLGCDKGSMAACAHAGTLYGGYEGVSPWPERSFQLLQQACDAGNLFGCGELGLNYQRGIGVAQNVDQARSLFVYACNQGLAQGCEYRRQLDAGENF